MTEQLSPLGQLHGFVKSQKAKQDRIDAAIAAFAKTGPELLKPVHELAEAFTKTEALRATGTDRVCRPVCTGFAQTNGSGRGQLRLTETPTVRDGGRAERPNPLACNDIDTARDGLRLDDREEAPPGFEPGMADLQSAALPLG